MEFVSLLSLVMTDDIILFVGLFWPPQNRVSPLPKWPFWFAGLDGSFVSWWRAERIRHSLRRSPGKHQGRAEVFNTAPGMCSALCTKWGSACFLSAMCILPVYHWRMLQAENNRGHNRETMSSVIRISAPWNSNAITWSCFCNKKTTRGLKFKWLICKDEQ